MAPLDETRLAVLETEQKNTDERLKRIESDIGEIKADLKDFKKEVKAEFATFRTELNDFKREVENRFTSLRTEMKADFRHQTMLMLGGIGLVVALGLVQIARSAPESSTPPAPVLESALPDGN